MVGKLEKMMQDTKNLQKRIDFMTEKLALADEKVNQPVISKMKG